MLKSKILDRSLPRPAGDREENASASFEQPRVVELDPDAYSAIQALRARDAGNQD